MGPGTSQTTVHSPAHLLRYHTSTYCCTVATLIGRRGQLQSPRTGLITTSRAAARPDSLWRGGTRPTRDSPGSLDRPLPAQYPPHPSLALDRPLWLPSPPPCVSSPPSLPLSLLTRVGGWGGRSAAGGKWPPRGRQRGRWWRRWWRRRRRRWRRRLEVFCDASRAVTRSVARRSGAAGSTKESRTRAGVRRAYLVLLTPESMRSFRPFR